MFLYRVKVDDIDAIRLRALSDDLVRSEEAIRAYCPIHEMSVVTQDKGAGGRELDICLALDDSIDADQLRRMAGQLRSLIGGAAQPPRVRAELISI